MPPVGKSGRIKVALYYPWIYLTSGAERTILELSGRSRHDWTIFTNHYDPQHTFPEFSKRRIVVLGHVPVKRSLVSVARAAISILKQRLPLDEYSAVVVVCEGMGDLILFRNASKPSLCICLTPLRPVFDPVYRDRALKAKSGVQRLALRAAAALFRGLDQIAWRRYRKVLCISNEVERRVYAGGLASKEKVAVVHPGLGFSPAVPSDSFRRFFLLPGRIMWTKNIELGIAAFKEFRVSHPHAKDFKLIVAGIVDEKSKTYYEKLQRLAERDEDIVFRVFPSDEELAELYAHCYAVLFTSFNEDWGMVPLEAMSFGKPVIAVNSGGPKETVLPGRNGLLAEPEPSAFARCMAALVQDPDWALRMGRTGHQMSQQFSWDPFVSRVDRELEEICDRSSGWAYAVAQTAR